MFALLLVVQISVAVGYSVGVAIDTKGGPVATGMRQEFLSVTMDWWDGTVYPSWGNASVLVADFENPQLIKLVRQLAPAYLRIGGTTVGSYPF